MVFDKFNEGFFRPLSLGNYKLNAECLLAIYRRFYTRHHPSPRKEDMLDTIRRVIEERPDLIEEPEMADEQEEGIDPTDIAGQARRRYNVFVQSGWIEETTRGLKTTAELGMLAQMMLETIDKVVSGLALEMSGSVAALKLVLNQLASGNDDAVIAVKACVDQLRAFERNLRATLTHLSNIRKDVIKQKTARDRINYLMNAFVEGVIMTSYKRMMQDENPARLRAAVKGLIIDFRSDELMMSNLGNAFTRALFRDELESPDSQTRVDAYEKGAQVFDDYLVEIEEILDDIGQTSDDIKKYVSQLEMQLASQAHYQHRMRAVDEIRLDQSTRKFASFMAASGGDLNACDVPSPFTPKPKYLAEHLLAAPKKAKQKIAAATVEVKKIDPLVIARNRLADQYLARTNPSDKTAMAFIERKMLDADMITFGDELIDNIDDYFICSKLIGSAMMGELPKEFSRQYDFVFHRDSLIQTRYVTAPSFSISRKQKKDNRNAA